MSPTLQVKLLRVLQEGEFERVGDVNTVSVDVRVVAATNRDLEDEIDAGRFRDDLYYRLNVVPIYIPPLRERRADISLLTDFFLAKYAERNGRTISAITPEARKELEAYEWPGNVRELQNYIERAVVLSTQPEITADLLPPQVRGLTPPRNIRKRGNSLDSLTAELVRQGITAAGPAADNLHKRIVDQVERELIQQVLDHCEGIQIKAAARLGINRNTLHKKVKELHIEADDSQPDDT